MSDKPKLCPLCDAPLEKRSGTGGKTEWWGCTAKFFWETLYKQTVVTHYAILPEDMEYIYLPPYRITSSLMTSKSEIHKLVQLEYSALFKIDSDIVFINTWQSVTTTPLIKPAGAAKMLERIKALLVFL